MPKLDEVIADVASQLDAQSHLRVQITKLNDVPETGPTNKGLWYRIDDVTAVFADLKRSTKLSTETTPKSAAYAYTYFIRAMALVLERFGAGYVDIQGDGIFGLFSGRGSVFAAAAAAITMRTVVEREVAGRFNRDTKVEWNLAAGFGIDQGTLLVRRLGLRGTKQNEVWAGRRGSSVRCGRGRCSSSACTKRGRGGARSASGSGAGRKPASSTPRGSCRAPAPRIRWSAACWRG